MERSEAGLDPDRVDLDVGVALAWIARRRGYRFVAVIDPKTTPENLARMRALGAHVERVDRPDEAGCYLRSRLERVRDLCALARVRVARPVLQSRKPARP